MAGAPPPRAPTGVNGISIPEKDLGAGIDARSAESEIAAGYVADALNVIPAEGRLRKRPGFQVRGGSLPVRVIGVRTTTAVTDNIILTLDSSIDLSMLASSPVILYGRTALTVGPFQATDAVHWYPDFRLSSQKTIGPGTTITTINASEHGFPSRYILVGLDRVLSATANEIVIPDSVTIDGSTANIPVVITTTTPVEYSVVPYYATLDPLAGTRFISTGNAVAGGGASTSFTILAGTHGLATANILVEVFSDAASVLTRVIPDHVTLSPAGDVTVVFTSVTTAFTATVALVSLDTLATISVGPGETTSVAILGAVTPYLFPAIYQELTLGGTREVVGADSVTYDAVTNSHVLTFTNGGSSAISLEIYYEYGRASADQLVVTASPPPASAQSTADTQLTLWGLDHSEIYSSDAAARAGWVTHLDTYRSSTQERPIASLGGVLHAEYLRTEDSVAANYLLPTVYPYLRSRVLADTWVAPLLRPTGDTPRRARGYVTGDGLDSGLAVVTAIAYQAGSGWTRLTLSVPSALSLDSTGAPVGFGGQIDVGSSLPDYVELSGTPHAVLEGTHRLRSASLVGDVLTLEVSIAAVTSSDYDDADAQGVGMAGVFTDHVPLATVTGQLDGWVPGDRVLSADFDETVSITVVRHSGTVLSISGVGDPLIFGSGLRILGRRTSRVVPLRAASGVLPASAAADLVRGDSLSFPPRERVLRALQVWSRRDSTLGRAASLVVASDGVTGTLALTGVGDDTTDFRAEAHVVVIGTGEADGEWLISSVTTATGVSLTAPRSITPGTYSAVLVTGAVELDEETRWEDPADDSTPISAVSRWLPVEAPDDSWLRTPSRHQFTYATGQYDQQSFLRSTEVADSTYVVSGSDGLEPVRKFDGMNVYRAGLPRWQAGVLLLVDTTATAKIILSPALRSVAYNAISAAKGTITATTPTDADTIPLGTHLRLAGDPLGDYIVTATGTPSGAVTPTPGLIVLDQALASTVTVGTATEFARYTYYFRLFATDINGHVTVSAVTGSEDFRADLTTDAAVRIRLTGFPVFDTHDWDRIELQIFRTPANQPAGFRLVASVPLTYYGEDGYVDFLDATSDESLQTRDTDTVTTALIPGGELGTGWEEPPRARCITSIGSRLLLGNIRDYPQIDVVLRPSTGTLAESDFTTSAPLWEVRRDTVVTSTTESIARLVLQFAAEVAYTPGAIGTSAGYVVVSAASSVSAGTGLLAVTLTVGTHNRAVGDWIFVYHHVVTSGSIAYSGWHQVTAVAATQVTFHIPARAIDIQGTPTATDLRVLLASRPTVTDHYVPVPIYSVLDFGSTNGNSAVIHFRAMRRLAEAANATQRQYADISINSGISPWLVAGGGADFTAGELILRSPLYSAIGPPTLLLPALPTAQFQTFVDGVAIAGGTTVEATERIFPSRLVLAYANYPEIIDSPYVRLQIESDSVVDINTEDGEEILAVVPLLSDSISTAALTEGVALIFKRHSIYALNTTTKALSRIETNGVGLSHPYSVSVSRNGVLFASDSGLYHVSRALDLVYVGRYVERLYQAPPGTTRPGTVDVADRELLHGHHNRYGRRYQLSYPLLADRVTDDVPADPRAVLTYDHTRESTGGVGLTGGVTVSGRVGGVGAWTRFEGIPAVGWANLADDSLAATTQGTVWGERRELELSRYRDLASPVSSSVLTRGSDAGDSGVRKYISSAQISYRVSAPASGTLTYSRIDLQDSEFATDPVVLDLPSFSASGVGDEADQSLQVIRYSLAEHRGRYVQLRIVNAVLDEDLDIAGIVFRVAGLSDRGVREAADR